MKPHRSLLVVLLLSLSTVALAQSDMHKMDAPKAAAPKAAVPKTEAQVSFDTIKALAGEWEGSVDVKDVPQMSGVKLHLSMRVTSRGNVLVHEFQQSDTPLDATKYDHPVTMLYVDAADQLTLVHYCDA